MLVVLSLLYSTRLYSTVRGIFRFQSFPTYRVLRAVYLRDLCRIWYMTVTMTPIVTKIISMADSFDSNSTDFGGRCTYQILQEIYTTKFGQPGRFTMTRSLRSGTPSFWAASKLKAEDPPTSVRSTRRPESDRSDEPRVDLLTRLFTRYLDMTTTNR